MSSEKRPPKPPKGWQSKLSKGDEVELSKGGESKLSKEKQSKSSAKRPARPRERSAGGVVVRVRAGERSAPAEVVVIVPTRRAADGSKVLCLPKGHLDAEETPQQAAIREVREETGVTAELIDDLGEVRYWYRRDGRAVPKSVAFFLFRYLSGDTDDHDDEVEVARWMNLREAREALSYEGEREVAGRALEALRVLGGVEAALRSSPGKGEDR